MLDGYIYYQANDVTKAVFDSTHDIIKLVLFASTIFTNQPFSIKFYQKFGLNNLAKFDLSQWFFELMLIT